MIIRAKFAGYLDTYTPSHWQYRRTVEERIAEKVVIVNGCHEWQGCLAGNPRDPRPTIRVKNRATTVTKYILEKKLGRPIKDGYFALHTCNNGKCVYVDHLYEGTAEDNARDRSSIGHTHRGEDNINAKLTIDAVREAKLLYSVGENQRPLARRYGVTQTTIRHAIHGITWKGVV